MHSLPEIFEKAYYINGYFLDTVKSKKSSEGPPNRLPVKGLSRRWTRFKESYFADCPRDELGHCKPSGQAGSSAGQKPAGKRPKPLGKAHQLRQLFDKIQKDGGFTYAVHDRSQPTEGMILSVFPERSWAKASKELTPHDIAAYAMKNRRMFHDRSNMLGAWNDREKGQVFLDVVVKADDAAKAEELAKRYDQIAYYDLKAQKEVIVNRAATSGGVASGTKSEAVKDVMGLQVHVNPTKEGLKNWLHRVEKVTRQDRDLVLQLKCIISADGKLHVWEGDENDEDTDHSAVAPLLGIERGRNGSNTGFVKLVDGEPVIYLFNRHGYVDALVQWGKEHGIPVKGKQHGRRQQTSGVYLRGGRANAGSNRQPLQATNGQGRHAGRNGRSQEDAGRRPERGKEIGPLNRLPQKSAGATCKPGERADLTHCIPAKPGAGAKPGRSQTAGKKDPRQRATERRQSTRQRRVAAQQAKLEAKLNKLGVSAKKIFSDAPVKLPDTTSELARSVEHVIEDTGSVYRGLKREAKDVAALAGDITKETVAMLPHRFGWFKGALIAMSASYVVGTFHQQLEHWFEAAHENVPEAMADIAAHIGTAGTTQIAELAGHVTTVVAIGAAAVLWKKYQSLRRAHPDAAKAFAPDEDDHFEPDELAAQAKKYLHLIYLKTLKRLHKKAQQQASGPENSLPYKPKKSWTVSKDSWFATCPRDEVGHCLPKGEASRHAQQEQPGAEQGKKPEETAEPEAQKPAGYHEPSVSDLDQHHEQMQREMADKKKPDTDKAPPPEGEKIARSPTGKVYVPDPTKPNKTTGLVDHSRVGVPALGVPPPPKSIPRMPNLTERERQVETKAADLYLRHPDQVANYYRKAVYAGIGDGPNIFNTDDAKLLLSGYNHQGPGISATETRTAKGEFNVAVHQVANAIAKRAFVQHLEDVVSKLPEDKKTVLVTSGGCAAGKGYALGHIKEASQLSKVTGGIWDAAGEQNATENEWVLQECRKRGIKATFAFIHADPANRWEDPKSGVVERAGKKGRMVDARLYADSYALGAKNFQAFHDKHKDDPDANFIFIDNHVANKPALAKEMPKEALTVDDDQLYANASRIIHERADKLPKGVVDGGTIGERIWGKPPGKETKALRQIVTKQAKKDEPKEPPAKRDPAFVEWNKKVAQMMLENLKLNQATKIDEIEEAREKKELAFKPLPDDWDGSDLRDKREHQGPLNNLPVKKKALTKAAESYFTDCPRDEHGHCLPKGEADRPAHHDEPEHEVGPAVDKEKAEGHYVDPLLKKMMANPKYLENKEVNIKNQEKGFARYAKNNDLDVNEVKKTALEDVNKVLAVCGLNVRVPGVSILEKILTDGRFKNQFETGTSEGLLDTDVRSRAEEDTQGVDQTTPADKRPIYGYVAPRYMTHASAHDFAFYYGSVVVHLKSTVRARTTVTFGDSLDTQYSATPLNQPELTALGDLREQWIYYAKDSPEKAVEGLGTYIEAQIHGGLKIEDIDEVCLPRYDSAEMKRVKQLLTEKKIKWEASC